MEERKRTIFAVVIALVLVAALLYSFGLNLFSKTPQLELADPGKTDGQPSAGTDLGDAAGIAVEVNTGTVQSVIASLSRYESYYRSLSVSYAWGDNESGQLDVEIWTDGGWTHTQTTLPSNVIEHAITGEDHMWLWYDDGADELIVMEGPAEDALADRMQYIPSYEDVLQLDVALITQADYLYYEGEPCIYVEAEHRELGYLYRYWISVTSGLLIASETEKSGVVVYRMDSGEVMSPIAAQSNTFALPDGTVLYGVD